MLKIHLPPIRTDDIIDPNILRIPVNHLMSIPPLEYQLSGQDILYVTTSRKAASHQRINIYTDGQIIFMLAGLVKDFELLGTIVGVKKQ